MEAIDILACVLQRLSLPNSLNLKIKWTSNFHSKSILLLVLFIMISEII